MRKHMTQVALSLGGNLGDRESNVASLERLLRAVLVDVRSSGLMETEPVGVGGPQPPYLNKIIVGRYAGTPRGLLEACFAAESALGRKRDTPKCPRAADADILLFGCLEVCEDVLPDPLFIPHPEILNRRFCLEGLARIDPLIVIPGIGGGRTAGESLKNMRADVAAQNVSFI
jgi:2-amino-4-hydroxy-6-hydroxymethyldihydropteridine diphosphokinase